MADKNEEKEGLQDIPTENEESPKQKKLAAAPAEIIAMGLRELMRKDHPDD